MQHASLAFACRCTDEVEPNDAGCGGRLNVAVDQQLDQWLEHDENLAKWDPNGRTVSGRRVLLTRWLAAVIEEIDIGSVSSRRGLQ